MSPVGWKLRARQQFSADKTEICSSRIVSAGRAILRSSRTVVEQCKIRSGMHPFGWKSLQPSLERSECQTRHTTHRDSEQPSVSKTSSRPSSSVHRKRDIAAAERWRGSFNRNRECTRSGGSAGPDSSSVQAKRYFAAAEEQ